MNNVTYLKYDIQKYYDYLDSIIYICIKTLNKTVLNTIAC